jgi:hypothetical protein
VLTQWLRATFLPTRYEPFQRLERINPVLQRELSIAQQIMAQQGLPTYDNKLLRSAFLIHILTFAAWFCASLFFLRRTPSLSPILLILPSLLISIGVDCYGSVRTIFRWYAASQRESWDTLRLTLRDDDELVHTYEAIGSVVSWAAVRMDVAMRVIPAVMGLMLGILIGTLPVLGLISELSLPSRRINIEDKLVMTALGFFWVRLAILYISDPIWRFRSNILWSLLCVIKFRDIAIATTAAIVGGLSIRLLHLGAIVVAWRLSEVWLAGYTTQPTLLLIGFYIVLGVLVPQIRWLYMRLYAWLERQTILALRRGDV